MKKTGRAYKFGDNISTDLIISGRYKFAIRSMKELAKHVMEDADSNFYQKTRKGPSFIVAGWNFGMGSSREQAPWAIKEAGILAVIAKNFARIFYRNSFNIGLALIECDTDLISQGDILELDIDKGYLKNKTKKTLIAIKPLHPLMKDLLKSGGIVKYFKKHRGLNFGA
ncbi:MAG: 3-isopropylmalate dehydratase small subunit [Candidatus Omnitrophota bacterium]|nr:MAG: 3-isopropylmalate dehydratase small subunit [Candidatus Omnitrophota bacterium]